MWTPEETETAVVELVKLGTVRGIKLDPRALLIWVEALSVYAFPHVMQGIRFLKTEWGESFLTVPLIVEAAGKANETPLGKWWESETLTIERGRELGLPALAGESWASYRARLTAAGDVQRRRPMLESSVVSVGKGSRLSLGLVKHD